MIQGADGKNGGHGPEFAGVSVSTTAGFYPEEGFDRVKSDEIVERQLSKAAKKLKLTSTAGWVASVSETSGKRIVEVSKSYAENQLTGDIELDWGPSEGGGGEIQNVNCKSCTF